MAGGRGFLSSMFTTMVAKLHSLASPSATSSSSSPHNNLEREMSKLTETMRRIQAKLDDLEEEESHVKSHSEKLWLSELKDVAYDAEDVVEEYEYEVLRSKQLHESNSGTHEDELANKVTEIRKRFDEITKEWKLLKLPKNAGKRKRSPMLLDMNRETGSLVVESDVLGREEEKDVLVKWLLSEDDTTGNGVSVIAVIGMGGLGKTTLAQLVYNDPRVKRYFDLTGWVCVSENFHVVSLTEKILQSFAKVKVHAELDELQRALQENLQRKRFLLVLDDVWNEEFTLWEDLSKPLLSAHVGKVIVTTRNQSVARIMGTRSPLNLNCLPFDVCWQLFKRVTLGGADKSLQPHLEHLGRKIVDKCKGLPLAVKVLGGALRNKEDIDSWEEILENQMWESEETNKGVLPALQISYDCMPIQLKRCFQYLSLFPKDRILDSEEIVRLWMSQGLLPLDGDKRAEDIGRNYIKRLAERSIIHLKWDDFFLMRWQYFSMHDLVHDLAQYIAQDEYLCVMDNKFDTKKLQKFRHLSFNVECHKLNIEALRELKLLRTLFMRDLDQWKYRVPDDLFQELKYIRTLVLDNCSNKVLAYSFGNLKLLRYLSIKDYYVVSIPESICSLYNLQTLDLQGTQISKLPRQIGNLINLRHFLLPYDYNGCRSIFFPPGIGNMTNLQTLNRFNVSCEKEHCDIGELNSLMKLRGQISISYVAYMNIFSNSKPLLKTKKYIDSLILSWRKYALYDDAFDYYEKDEKKAEWQLEYLEPHVNLKTLKITRYTGIKFVGWVGASSFTRLTSLSLNSCHNCNKLPSLGQLPSLEKLEISRMDGIRHVGREFCSMLMASPSSSQNKIAFPSLKDLIFDMINWEAWDGVEIGDFPSLYSFKLSGCRSLIKFPRWPFLSSVEEMTLDSGGVPDVLNFHSLINLTIMSMSKKNSKWMSKCYFPTLQHLTFEYSIDAESVHLSQKLLPSLKTLEIHYSDLRVVTGLKNLTSLNSLTIKVCHNLEFKGLPATLEQVKLDNCRLFEKGYREQQHMPNDLMIEAHNSDDEEEEEEEMDGDDDDNMD